MNWRRDCIERRKEEQDFSLIFFFFFFSFDSRTLYSISFIYHDRFSFFAMEEDFFSSLDDPNDQDWCRNLWKACGPQPSDALHFVEFLSRLSDNDDRDSIFLSAVEFFWDAVLCGDDLHVFAEQERPSDPQPVVASLWRVVFAAEKKSSWRVPLAGPPRFASGNEVAFVFGGQGHDYWPSLTRLFRTYPFCRDLVRGFLALLSSVYASPECPLPEVAALNPAAWIDDDDIASAPFLEWPAVSTPLIGLLQMTHFFVLCRLWNVAPSFFTTANKNAVFIGHSQGSVAALALAGCATMEEFYRSARAAVSLLCWIGIRVQQVYPLREGSSMLLVTGMTESEYGGEPEIVVHNATRSFVLADEPQKLQKAAEELSKKEGVRCRFLPIKAPFHSKKHLESAMKLIIRDMDDYCAFQLSFRVPRRKVISCYSGS